MRRRRRNVDVDAGVAVGIAVKCLCVYCVCCSVCPFVVGVDKHWLLGIEIGQGRNRVTIGEGGSRGHTLDWLLSALRGVRVYGASG